MAHFEYESVMVDFKQVFILKEKNEMVGMLTPNIRNRNDDSVTSMDEFGIIDSTFLISMSPHFSCPFSISDKYGSNMSSMSCFFFLFFLEFETFFIAGWMHFMRS